jgi:hypothetical protein
MSNWIVNPRSRTPLAHRARLALAVITTLALPLLADSSFQQSMYSVLAPSTASSDLYFAHFTDGAGWSTSLFLSNPNPLLAATVNVVFYDDTGTPVAVDFGSGASPTLQVTIPAGGTKVVTSTGSAAVASTGWAHATANIPVMGTLMYRAMSGDKAQWDVAAVSSAPTYYYYSYATPQIGVALDNPSATKTIHLLVTARDAAGKEAGTYSLTLAPLAHTSFNLGTAIAALPDDFKGSILVSSTDTPMTSFLGYTLNVRDSLLAPLPPGELQSPGPGDRMLADAAAQMRSSFVFWIPIALQYGDFADATIMNNFLTVVGTLSVKITSDTSITASYQSTPTGLQVNVSRPLLETMSGNKSALTFLISHYAVRAAIAQYGNPSTYFKNDAVAASDLCALITLMMAGMDPSGMVDFYARMQLAYGLQLGLPSGSGPVVDPALQTEFLLNGDYSARIAAVWKDLVANGCFKGGKQGCTVLHDLWHPNYPAQIP